MKIKKKNLFLLVSLSTIIAGCGLIQKVEEMIQPQGITIQKNITQQKTISLACNQDSIKEYLDKGWKIINSEEKEIPCTWKTKKARSNCNVNKDKGCRITVPDKMGKQFIYTIEKEVSLEESVK